MFFEIRTLEIIDENKVNIIFNIKSVIPQYVNKINIYGNTRTQDQVIRREMVFAEGDPVNPFLIQKSYRNIEKLNFFKKIDILEKKLNDDQVYSNIHKYGNTTAASIPIALAEAINEGKILDGDKVVLASFGSGFAWASAIMEW